MKVDLRQLLAGAAVGYLAARVIAPKVGAAAKKDPKSIYARYGVAPYLLVGGYAAQRLGSGLVRQVGDTAMVSGAMLLGASLGRSSTSEAAASQSMLLSPGSSSSTSDDKTEGEDEDVSGDLTRSERRALAAFDAVQGEMERVQGDLISGDDDDDGA